MGRLGRPLSRAGCGPGTPVHHVKRLTAASITTVALLTAHSKEGLGASSVHLGPKLLQQLVKQLEVRGLALAEDNSGVLVDYIINYTIGLFGWWTQENQRAFAKALGLRTLGDVSRLTVERIRSVPFHDYTTARPNPVVRPMSSDSPEDVRYVVATINSLLRRYDLEPIPTN